MKVTGFIWLDDTVYKLQRKHGVEQQEVRELFNNRPNFRFVEKGHRSRENVYSAAGQTDAGRYLIVFLCIRRIEEH